MHQKKSINSPPKESKGGINLFGSQAQATQPTFFHSHSKVQFAAPEDAKNNPLKEESLNIVKQIKNLSHPGEFNTFLATAHESIAASAAKITGYLQAAEIQDTDKASPSSNILSAYASYIGYLAENSQSHTASHIKETLENTLLALQNPTLTYDKVVLEMAGISDQAETDLLNKLRLAPSYHLSPQT
jgi:hypothetical protein